MKSLSKRQIAVALKYIEGKDIAPKVVAKGWDYVAMKILETAKQHNIPLHNDRDIAEVLMAIELGQYIPPELYQVVAKILAYIYRINKNAS